MQKVWYYCYSFYYNIGVYMTTFSPEKRVNPFEAFRRPTTPRADHGGIYSGMDDATFNAHIDNLQSSRMNTGKEGVTAEDITRVIAVLAPFGIAALLAISPYLR
jgi:hypothetical protein